MFCPASEVEGMKFTPPCGRVDGANGIGVGRKDTRTDDVISCGRPRPYSNGTKTPALAVRVGAALN